MKHKHIGNESRNGKMAESSQQSSSSHLDTSSPMTATSQGDGVHDEVGDHKHSATHELPQGQGVDDGGVRSKDKVPVQCSPSQSPVYWWFSLVVVTGVSLVTRLYRIDRPDVVA